ncbi:40S ribosomal protein S3 [Perkinsela sp. CCAP 1560/4]|nr:40S ribosomal protein S3 [Perkinsela sp. CCAP 1560/4]|eukprot:KNH06232.1 40S ribosomal protein S3 [Perkinsela sp. CCAP 1560/4]
MGQLNKKKKFVADGVFAAELNEFLKRQLAEFGYCGVEHRVTPQRTDIFIRATKTQDVMGPKNERLRQLTTLIQRRFNFPEGGLQIYTDKVLRRGLSAAAQAQSLRYKLLGQVAVRKACYNILRFAMEAGALGIEIIVKGKVRQQRAKSMKFRQGYMIKSGDGSCIDTCRRSVLVKQGILGIKVSIMLPPGEQGVKAQPDKFDIPEAKAAY